MESPAGLDQETLPGLQKILENYPYFQSARILYLLNLKAIQDSGFSGELRRCAAHAPDRAKLRRLIQLKFEMQSPVESPVSTEKLIRLEEQIRLSMQEIEQKKHLLDRLIREKNALAGPDDEGQAADESASTAPLRALPKDDLLDEFIRERNLLSGARTPFFSPEESARRSIEENYGVLSETLARLIAAQGHKDKAIKIYQQLMLKNPQKSSYFAAQIEKLRKEL
jgi:tetratricopeptide (TPR) repeat protein